jgi:hypothetical protein
MKKMHIFSSLRYYDAKWVPTGKEGTEMREGTVVASQYGKSMECTLEDGTKHYIPLWNELSYPIDTHFKGFRWVEIGRIGRGADNKFHDEDVKDSTERSYRVSELIL